MSSIGFPRSRPRARQQRATKTPCYAHPRFLQLVKELARIDDIKKKQDEQEQSDASSGCGQNTVLGSITSATCLTNDDLATTSSNLEHPASHRRPQHHHHHNHLHHHPQHQQGPIVNECWHVNASPGGSNCCTTPSEAHTSNGCRSLDCSRSTSALNDSYYRQNSSNDNSQVTNHGLHHQQNYHQQRHYNYTASHYTDPIDSHSTNVSQSHNSHQDYRCPSKSTTSSTVVPPTSINLGYSKTSLMVQSSDNSNNDLDQRQDENRSKRKRSNNDTSSTGKKVSPSLSPSSCSKRHKSSPEPVRPLSPSFTKCPICLLDCMDRDPSFTNTCFHLFCFVCIENWSKSKATCPLCRTKFSKIIYNIKSASCFDEKVASPIRRDDDDDRLIYEQLHGLNANTLSATRTSSSEEARLLFDNLRHSHNSVLPPQFALLDHQFNRHVNSIQNFNSVTTNPNFNHGVPHTPFTTASYNPVGSNYIALLASNDRSQAATSGPAISSAYTTNISSNIVNSDTGNRRIGRSGRYPYSRAHDLALIDGSARISRSTSTDLNQPGISLEPRHHHYHHQLPHGAHHQNHGQHNQPPHQPHHRSAVATIQLGPRQDQRVTLPNFLPYLAVQPRYVNTNVYSRRPYANPPAEQHILNLYRQMPDI